nr:EamA family transporter [uncultured Limosilactobacillus sp.]
MSSRQIGITMAISGAILWGASGAAVQYLFANPTINEYWLVGLRLLGAGILLVVYSVIKNFAKVKALLSSWSRVGYLILFSFFGMCTSQLSYFVAVKYSNAPTATVIQFLGPVFIISYLAIRTKTLPRRIDVISIVVALLGTFLLVTGGHIDHLALSPLACLWGLLAAISEAVNTIMPRDLFKEYGTINVVGWSMLISGLAFLPLYWRFPVPKLSTNDVGMIFFIIIFGTLLAYTLFLGSVKYIQPSTTGMLAAFEPLVATILAVAFLDTPFGLADWIGSGLIILATIFQSWPNSKTGN